MLALRLLKEIVDDLKRHESAENYWDYTTSGPDDSKVVVGKGHDVAIILEAHEGKVKATIPREWVRCLEIQVGNTTDLVLSATSRTTVRVKADANFAYLQITEDDYEFPYLKGKIRMLFACARACFLVG